MRIRWLGKGAGLAFVIVAGCSQASPSGGEGAQGTTRQAIQSGTTDSTHTFAVGVCGGSPGGCAGICSGALITPNLVVTARHCVSQTSKQIDCTTNPQFGGPEFNDMWITTNTNMLGGGGAGWHQVENILVPNDDHVCGHDIALLILSDLVPDAEAHPITPGVRIPMDDKQYDEQFAAVGYGSTSPQNTGTGTRRVRVGIPIQCIPGSKYLDCPGAGVNANEFVGGSGTCEGDSGSSAYEEKSFDANGGKGAVSFGVLSRGGVSQDGTKCEGSLYTRLDKWRDLVVNAAAQASKNWTLYPKPSPDWTQPPPPPATEDAGTTTPPPTSKPKGELGATCTANGDCASGTCATFGDGKVCSSSCDPSDASSCPDGYTCSDSLCLPASSSDSTPQATTTTTTTSGCAVAADPTQPTPWRWGATIAAALGLAVARRRRRSDA